MTSKSKRIVAVATAALLVAVLAVGVPLRYQERMQAIHEGGFYCYSFQMLMVRGEWLSDPFGEVTAGSFVATLFARVEYVMEFPPEDRQGRTVFYIKPDDWSYGSGDDYIVSGTQGRINDLNEIIAADPGIAVSDRLSLPLTEDQVLSSPDDVLDIIRQLDKEQWDYFHRGQYMPTIEVLARAAGIEPPTE
jgi:hypothetical protein